MCFGKLRERMYEELEDIANKDTLCRYDIENTKCLIESLNGLTCITSDDTREHISQSDAESWVSAMSNADGTRGAHWTREQTDQVAAQRGIQCDRTDLWAIMNMMYSDYCKVASKHSVDTAGFYADMAKAFIEDTDAVDGKVCAYRHYIVK